jgi:uncharacterized protein (DUF427 family)
MSEKPFKIPGPDHPITITPFSQRVRVIWRGHVVAETQHALTLAEASYPAVHYIPRADVDGSRIVRTDHTSHCPYKGDASYFSLVDGDARSENAIWSYEDPHEAVAAIAGYVAFYPSRVDRIEMG